MSGHDAADLTTDRAPGADLSDTVRVPAGAADLGALAGYPEPPTRPGALGRLGEYELLEVIGRGAFGVVFRASDDVLRREVAVKVLDPARAADPAATAVRHPNVVNVYAVGDRPLPHLVMECVAGRTLRDRLDAGGPLPPTTRRDSRATWPWGWPRLMRAGWSIGT